MILYKGTKQLNKMENLKNFFKALLDLAIWIFKGLGSLLSVVITVLESIVTFLKDHPKATGRVAIGLGVIFLVIIFPNAMAQLIALGIMLWIVQQVFSTKKAPTQSPRNNNRRNNNNRRR
jgi:hypothetical protein